MDSAKQDFPLHTQMLHSSVFSKSSTKTSTCSKLLRITMVRGTSQLYCSGGEEVKISYKTTEACAEGLTKYTYSINHFSCKERNG